jgi:hypothetical protein
VPIDHEVPAERTHVEISGHGPLTITEFRSAVRRLRADPSLDGIDRSLVDLRNVHRFAFEGHELRQFAGERATLPCLPGETKVAVVVGTEEGFGLARMYELSRSSANEEIRTFRCCVEAKAWLGLTHDVAEAESA